MQMHLIYLLNKEKTLGYGELVDYLILEKICGAGSLKYKRQKVG